MTNLLIENMDRLSRSIKTQMEILDFFESKGLTLIISETGEIIDPDFKNNPGKKLILGINGIVSEHAKDLIVQRLKAGRDKSSKRLGHRTEGSKAFYHTTDEGRLIIKRIQKLRRKKPKGKQRSWQAVADALNREHILTKSGGLWTGPHVYNTLHYKSKKGGM